MPTGFAATPPLTLTPFTTSPYVYRLGPHCQEHPDPQSWEKEYLNSDAGPCARREL